MLSVISHAGIRCCDSGAVFNKARYCDEKMPWVDMVIGIILITIAELALNGYLPLDCGQWLLIAGSIELGIGFLIKFVACCCSTECNVGYSKIEELCEPATIKVQEFCIPIFPCCAPSEHFG